jgi:hypothetical protein
MEKLESLTGGITSSLANYKNATNCTADIEADLYQLQYSRSTTKESFALRNVQHSTPSETTDWMDEQQRTPFETTDCMKDCTLSCLSCSSKHFLHFQTPNTHRRVHKSPQYVYLLSHFSFHNHLSWSLQNV